MLLGFCALSVCVERGVAQRACPPHPAHASRALGSTLVPAGPAWARPGALPPGAGAWGLGPGAWRLDSASGWRDLEPALGPRPRGRSRCARARPVAAACPLGPGPLSVLTSSLLVSPIFWREGPCLRLESMPLPHAEVGARVRARAESQVQSVTAHLWGRPGRRLCRWEKACAEVRRRRVLGTLNCTPGSPPPRCPPCHQPAAAP